MHAALNSKVSGSSMNQHAQTHKYIADRNDEYLINKSNTADPQTLKICSIAHRLHLIYANLCQWNRAHIISKRST